MKKLTVFALTLVLAISSFAPVMAQTQIFRDIPPSHFAFEAISWVSDPANGAFMVGDAGNNFNPSRILNKFEAAQIFAMAAGFRHITPQLTPAEREIFNRSFEMWRPFLDSMASTYSRWNRTFDREISFLLYQGILTINDVNNFITSSGGQEQINQLTRQDAITWTVRLIGRGAHAQAITLPHHTPFRDDSLINPALSRYLYYAAETGIIQGTGGYIAPLQQFTRAETAVLFFTVLADNDASIPSPGAATNVATITGTVQSMVADTQINIASTAGIENFRFAQGSVVMVDNQERTPAFLRDGMAVTALINAQREILTIVARSEDTPSQAAQTPSTPLPSTALYSDEGFVAAVGQNTITIRTRRIRLNGQIVDDERMFNMPENAKITRGGAITALEAVQTGDMVAYRFRGSNIYELSLLDNTTTPTARHTVDGRLTGISISEYNSQITLSLPDGGTVSHAVMPGVFDVFTLRIGTDLRLVLENQTVTEVHLMRTVQEDHQNFVGYIQAIHPASNQITVVAGHGTQTRHVNVTITQETIIRRAGVQIGMHDLRGNVNVYVNLAAPGSNVASTITVLP